MSATVIAHRVEFFAECGPDGVPNRGVGDSVVNQDDGVGTSAAFLVVDFAFLDFDEMAGSGLISGAEYADGRREDDERETELEQPAERASLHATSKAKGSCKTLALDCFIG